MGMTQGVALFALTLFFVLMVGIGIWSSRRTKTMNTFLLGGRNIGAWMSAFAYTTSYFSAVIFIGYAGKTGWQVGIGGIWIGIGNAILGCLLAWLLLAKRTRCMTHRLSASTMPEFFSARYQSDGMKMFAALIIFVFLVPYAATVYKGLGYLFGKIFPFLDGIIPGVEPEIYCMFIIALLTAVYLVLGGYVATIITDFIQGIIMLVGIILLVAVIVSNPTVGGFANGFASLREISASLSDADLTSWTGGPQWRFLLMNVLLTSFGTWGLPQMVHKYYAIKDESSIHKATVLSTLFALIIGVGAYVVGTFGRLYLNNQLPAGNNYDAVVPEILYLALTEGVWTNVLLSIILLLVLSASMSTLSSIVLTSSSSIAVDLLPLCTRKVDKKKQLLLMRLLCFLFIGASFVFASFKIAFIMQLMSFSWGVVAGSFIGPYFWGLYSKKITRAGAWSGMLSGLIVVGGGTLFCVLTNPAGAAAGFQQASSLSQDLGVAAMAFSFVIVPLVSLFTKSYSASFTDTILE